MGYGFEFSRIASITWIEKIEYIAKSMPMKKKIGIYFLRISKKGRLGQEMRSGKFCFGLVLTTTWIVIPVPAAFAQLQIVDDLILIARAKGKVQQVNAHQHLPGVNEGNKLPGMELDPSRLGERAYIGYTPSSIISAASQPGMPALSVGQTAKITPPTMVKPLPKSNNYGGPFDLNLQSEPPAPNAKSLDQLLEILVNHNYDLLTKAKELPKADADILTAGLRSNPAIFANVDTIPYGNFSPNRPGATNYGLTIAQSVDVNQKRRYRIRVAQGAKRVLEAQYQDAVRLQIDNLYRLYMNYLESKQTLQAMKIGLAGLQEVKRVTEDLVKNKQQSESELKRINIQLYSAELAVDEAQESVIRTRRELGTLLGLSPQETDELDVIGDLRDKHDNIPDIEELKKVALQVRPDLVAFRLAVSRAEEGVRLAKAERFDDVFAFYTPYAATNNGPIGGMSTTSWGMGVLFTLPVFNRNQGNIRRARINVQQFQIELEGYQRQLITDIQKAIQEHQHALHIVESFEKKVLPEAKQIREDKLDLYKKGRVNLVAFLEAQREYNDIAEKYLKALVHLRSVALQLNTVVGQRIVP